MAERRAIITVPAEMALDLQGVRLAEVPDGHLQRTLLEAAQEWIRVKRLEGEEFVEKLDIHVYGPYASPAMIEAMLSSEHMAIGQVEREQITLERGSFAHFVMNAFFSQMVTKAATRSAISTVLIKPSVD